MSFRSDTRARVPFAFIGALLLLTSTLYATTAAPPVVRDPVAPAVIDESQTTARVALSTAIRDAGREAGRRPVLEPSDSGMGRLLDERRPFHSYLRLLIALHARSGVSGVSASRAGVTAAVSAPPIRDRAEAARAMENVSISPASDGKYRVNVTDLRVEVTRDGRHTDTIPYDASFVVRIPALRLHQDVSTYQERLNTGLAKPGLAQSLTPRLFAIAWTRGYAQYGGAPITNVLANRHVEVMTNDALVDQQTAVFGAVDAEGDRATRQAAADVALRDGRLGAKRQVKNRLPNSTWPSGPEDGRPPSSLPDSFDREHSYDVDRSADEAFVDFAEGGAGRNLGDVVDSVYRAQVRGEADARYRGSERIQTGSVPPNATLAYTYTSTDRRLDGGTWQRSSTGRTLRTFDGTAVVDHRTTRLWVWNRTYATTTHTHRETYDIDVAIRFRYRGAGPAPDRRTVGNPFGPEARSSLVDRSGSVVSNADGERLGLDAIGGDAHSAWQPVDVEPPAEAEAAAYDETAALRDRVKDVEVSLEARSIASAANPASQLAATLERRESALVEAPSRYDSARERAETAARLVYLRGLQGRLSAQSSPLDRAQQRLSERLRAHGVPSTPPEPTTERGSSIATTVDAEPVYLSLAARSAGEPALAARNVNLFSVPYGDAADTITGELSVGESSVSLVTAARTLDSMESLPDEAVNASVRDRRSALEDALRESLSAASTEYRSTLDPEVGPRRSKAAVDGAFRRWNSPATRAMAIADGRMAAAIVDELSASVESRERDLLAAKLRVVSSEMRESSTVRIEESVVEDARTVHEDVTRGELESALETGGERAAGAAWKRATGKSAAGLPAGLPLLPVPGSWYVTANAWTVSVRGSYDRFVVRAPRAAPGRAENGSVEYVRTEAEIARDVDGDGRKETLGRNRPVSFSVDTGVLVVVPPGGTGVGDVDGDADERSPGW